MAEEPTPDDDMERLRQQVGRMFAAHAPKGEGPNEPDTDDDDEPVHGKNIVPREGGNPAVDGGPDEDVRQWVASIFDPTRLA